MNYTVFLNKIYVKFSGQGFDCGFDVNSDVHQFWFRKDKCLESRSIGFGVIDQFKHPKSWAGTFIVNTLSAKDGIIEADDFIELKDLGTCLYKHMVLL